MKTLWKIRARNMDDEFYRNHWHTTNIVAAVLIVFRAIRKHDDIVIVKSKIHH